MYFVHVNAGLTFFYLFYKLYYTWHRQTGKPEQPYNST